MITKICGIKTIETLVCCVENKVNFFGMIFYSKSPRNISFNEAKNLQNFSEKLNINGVAVFVDEEINTVNKLVENLKLKYIQLHGNEDNNYIINLKKLNVKVIKSLSISKSEDLEKVYKYNSADYFLFDYKPKKDELPGGNSKSFNWNIIRNYSLKTPWFLSGGINLRNINIVKSKICPFGIDLSSGVEKELGIKDIQIINKLMSKINNA
tara:strand:+ start:1563 stop:2192 length:630 start_codon:yes stop_codon:yes gene_type:complete